MIRTTALTRSAYLPRPAAHRAIRGTRALAILASAAALTAGVLLTRTDPQTLAPVQAAANQPDQVAVSVGPLSLDQEHGARVVCGPEFYVTGDLVGEANPTQIYAAACGR
jgi:hypothetical protein